MPAVPISKTVAAFDVNHPLALPAGVQAGDLLILFLAADVALPAGFTDYLRGAYYIVGSPISYWRIGYRIATANEPAQFTLPFVGGHAALVAHRGVDAENPFDASATYANNGQFPSMSTTRANTLIWRVCCWGYWSGGVGWPGSVTEYFDTWHELGTGDNMGGAYGYQGPAGPIDTVIPVLNEGGGWVTQGAAVFALNSGPVPPTVTIAEIYPHQADNVIDPNQRNEVGFNDSYVELLAVNPPTAGLDIGGYKLLLPIVGAASAVPFSLPAGTIIYDRLVCWLDDMLPGVNLLPAGIVQIQNPEGVPIVSVSYEQPDADEAWDGQSVPPTPGV